jgi:molecular chaperone GrpE
MTSEEDIKEENMLENGALEPLDSATGDMDNGDVHYESDEEIEAPAVALKKLRAKNAICEKEKKEYLDGWQRMRADFANARKEEETKRGEMIKFASEGLVEDLLPVLDSFTSAFGNKETWEKVDANWRKGVEYIYAQFYSVLESRGLASIGDLGEKLDPRIHIVLDHTDTESDEQIDTVAEVVQKGYRLHNKVIRPASVKVFGYKKE